jgi:hypothetical protein
VAAYDCVCEGITGVQVLKDGYRVRGVSGKLQDCCRALVVTSVRSQRLLAQRLCQADTVCVWRVCSLQGWYNSGREVEVLEYSDAEPESDAEAVKAQ